MYYLHTHTDTSTIPYHSILPAFFTSLFLAFSDFMFFSVFFSSVLWVVGSLMMPHRKYTCIHRKMCLSLSSSCILFYIFFFLSSSFPNQFLQQQRRTEEEEKNWERHIYNTTVQHVCCVVVCHTQETSKRNFSAFLAVVRGTWEKNSLTFCRWFYFEYHLSSLCKVLLLLLLRHTIPPPLFSLNFIYFLCDFKNFFSVDAAWLCQLSM